MTTLIRSEFLQLRTLRSSYAVALTLLLMVVGLTWGDVAESGLKAASDQLANAVMIGGGFGTALIGALFAAARVAGDYRYGTIANRVLATPQRTRFMMARLAGFSLLGASVALIAMAVALVTAAALLETEGTAVVLSAGDAVEFALRLVVVGALFTALGAIVGFMLRSQQAAMVAIFGTFLAEKVLADPLGDVGTILPFASLDRLLDISGDGAVGGGLVLAATVVALAGIAGTLLSRRDIH